MVEVKYNGRLGNNLFQYCFGRILAENLHYKLRANPIPGFRNTKTKVDGQDYSSYPTQILQGHAIDLKSIIQDKTKRRIIVDGFFQRYEYYREYKDIIRNDWLLTDIQIKESIGKNDIVVHVRGGDYKNTRNALSFSFYEEALNGAKYERLFLCTDDMGNPFIRRFRKYNAIIHHTNPLEDFQFTMSFSKIILSQSTFSWWAAFLSNAKEIYFPLPLSGYWSKQRPDVELKLDDENRYIYIKCKEIYDNMTK